VLGGIVFAGNGAKDMHRDLVGLIDESFQPTGDLEIDGHGFSS
jgi:hypothetical protein